MTVTADVAASLDFLEKWKPGGPWILTAISLDRQYIRTSTFRPEAADDLRAWLLEQEEQKRNVYFMVNSAMRPLEKKAEKTDVQAMDWLHVDVDPNPAFDLEDERKRILSLLQSHQDLPEPTAVIFSGGGYQGFWRLSDPLDISGNTSKWEEAERYNMQLELVLQADACHNCDRIMRLPGTINWPTPKKAKKGQVPVRAELVSWNTDNVYGIGEFTKAATVQDKVSVGGGGPEVNVSGNVHRISDLDAELPKTVPDRVKVVIVQGFDPDQPLDGHDQSRSAWLWYVVNQLITNEVDDDTVYSIITDPDFRISDSVLDKGNASQIDRYAKRQIQQAKENEIDPWLASLNSKYAWVESVGGRGRIAKETYDHALGRNEIEFQLPDSFKITYGNQFVDMVVPSANGNAGMKSVPVGKWWLQHRFRRSYEGVVFYPEHNFKGQLNLWRGFGCDAIPGDCSLFLAHIHDNLCRGDEERNRYMIGWMAYAVQFPWKPAETALVFKGKQGTGKGMFAHTFGSLFGTHNKHITNPKHLLGNFNGQLRDAALVFADEAFNTQSPQHESALKALITEPMIMVELKGVDAVPMRNCVHLIIAGNEDWLVPARLDDRRFFITEVETTHRRDSEYFGAMQQQMDTGGREALLHFLLNYDLAGFDIRRPPQTDELRQQQDHTMTPMEGFWYEKLHDGRILPDQGNWPEEIGKDQLVDAFRAQTETRLSSHQVKTKLGRFLRIFGIDSTRKRGSMLNWTDARGTQRQTENPWVWRFPKLSACRAAWNAEFGARDWPEQSDDPVSGVQAF